MNYRKIVNRGVNKEQIYVEVPIFAREKSPVHVLEVVAPASLSGIGIISVALIRILLTSIFY